MERIPLDAKSDRYHFPLTLDGVACGIRCYWLPRAGSWYLDLLDASLQIIAAGVRINPGTSIAFPAAGDGVPPGVFVASGPSSYGHDDLGTQVFVDYVTEAELAAA